MTVEHAIPSDLYQAYADARDVRDTAQREMDLIKEQLLLRFPVDGATPKHVFLLDGVEVASLSRTTTTRIDTKKLKRDYPDIAQMYCTTSFSTRLVMK